jgi:SulP family sulfate permease
VRPAALWRGDVLGGFTAAVVMLAIEGSYGIVAFAPLGPQFAATAFAIGVWAAVVANLVGVAAGSRGPLLAGPSAALSLLVPPLLVALLADPAFRVAGGAPDVPRLLAAMAVGVMLAGLLQVMLGLLRLGRVISYVPYPVHAGFMTGVAVLMALAMLPHVLGLPARPLPTLDLGAASPLALAVAAVALAISLRPPRGSARVPAFLLALACASALHHGLAALLGPERLGPTLGTLSAGWPGFELLPALADPGLLAALAGAWPTLLQFAAAVAVTSTMQTLMASSAVDGLTNQRRDGERVLRAQGAANVAAGVAGLLPGAGAVSVTMVGLRAGARGTAARVVHGAVIVVALLFATGLLRHLPMAAIAGAFVAVAWSLVDAWSRRASVAVARDLLRLRWPPPSLRVSYGVMVFVAAVSVFVSLTAGVALGVLLSVLMFVRSNLRQPVRRIGNAAARRSLRIRPATADATLRTHGERIVVVELDGALFFGTADAAARALEGAVARAAEVIVDFRRVSEIDASGARVLLQAGARLRAGGRRLLLSGLGAPDEPRRAALLALDVGRVLDADDFHPDIDRALEAAEDRLLDRLAPAAARAPVLDLAATQIADGLDAAGCATLRSLMAELTVPRGTVVFARGDPGDAVYVLLAGQVGIWLRDPASGTLEHGRRLVSFSPGVPFGEIGLLRAQPRTADAVAEADSRLLVLDRQACARLEAEHPALHARLMRNLALHLADRLRALTDELESTADR